MKMIAFFFEMPRRQLTA